MNKLSFSNALLEAMSVGLPIIASNVGANADMIEENGGVIVPVRDVQAIVDAIISLNNPEILYHFLMPENFLKNRLFELVLSIIFGFLCR